MSEEKVFCGSARVITTKYGELTKVSFSEKDLEALKGCLDNGWVNCVVKEKKNKVEGKPTHYLEVDTWKPDAQKDSDAKTQESNEAGNDLPF